MFVSQPFDDLSFSDIIGMLRLGLESLIGPADASLLTPNPANLRHRRRRSLRVEDERLETCDAGILGSPIFGYEFPVIGVSVCSEYLCVLSNLQAYNTMLTY